MPDDNGDVTLTVSSTPYRLVLRDPKGVLQYIEGDPINNQEGMPDIPVAASWPRMTPAGMGEGKRTSPESMGYAYTVSMDATAFGFIRLCARQFSSSTPSNAITDVPTFIFEEQDSAGNKYVYFINGRYVYKTELSGTTITIQEEKDLGANATGGRPAKLGGTWYIPAGPSVNFWKLTTVANSPVTDTWAQDGSLKALAFATTSQGVTSALVRAHTINKVDISTDGTTFGADFDVGESDIPITSMIDTGVTLFVAKQDNLWELSQAGVARKLTRFPTGSRSSNYGCGLMAPEGGEVAYYNHEVLILWDGTRARDVGIDANPLLQAIPNISAEPFRGEHFETAYGSDAWIWSNYREPSVSANGFLLAQQRSEGGAAWHSIFHSPFASGPMRGLYVDSRNILWSTFPDNSGSIFFGALLGTGGTPDPGAAGNGYGLDQDASSYQWYGAETDFGFPHTLKQFRVAELKVRNLDTTCPTKIQALIDGAAPSQVGATFTSNGVIKRFWTTGSSDTGYDLRPQIIVSTTGSYLSTTDPQIHSLIIRANLRPDGARRILFTVFTEKEKSGIGGMGNHDGPATLTALRAAERAAPVASNFIDPAGNALTIYVTKVTSRPTFADADSIQYAIDVEAIVWNNS